MSHHCGAVTPEALGPAQLFEGHATGYACAPIVDQDAGSLHQRGAVSELAPGGAIDRHAHSYEEGVYLLSGRATLLIGGTEHELAADDFALIETGSRHAWQNAGAEPARWLEVSASQPKQAGADFPCARVAAIASAFVRGPVKYY